MYASVFAIFLSLTSTHTHTHDSLSVEDTVVWSGDTDTLPGQRPTDREKKDVLQLSHYLLSGFLCLQEKKNKHTVSSTHQGYLWRMYNY